MTSPPGTRTPCSWSPTLSLIHISTLVSLKGLVLVACGVDPANFTAAETEILDQLAQLQRGEFTTEEFQAARKSVVSALRSAQDEQGRMCSYWLLDRAAGEPFDLNQLIAQVEDVTCLLYTSRCV